MITPAARERLAREIETRALDLGLTLRDLAQTAGLSYEALRNIRHGTGGMRPLTARKVEAALRWENGSINRILDGGEPVALPPANGGRHRRASSLIAGLDDDPGLARIRADVERDAEKWDRGAEPDDPQEAHIYTSPLVPDRDQRIALITDLRWILGKSAAPIRRRA
jgi:hypothetical protein